MTPDSQMIWSALIQTFPTLLQVGGFFLSFQMIPAFLFALGMRRFNLARWFVVLGGLGIIFSLYTVSLFNFFLDARLPAPFYFSLVLTGFVIGFALVLLSPFSPSIIAFTLRSPKRWLVFGLNVALLCTIVGPLGLLYLAMARPKVVANSQAVSPDGVELAALNTVTDAELLKEVTPQSSDPVLDTIADANSTNADVLGQPAQPESSAELESKPIAHEKAKTDIATDHESVSLTTSEPTSEQSPAPDAAAPGSPASMLASTEESSQPKADASLSQTENELAQEQSKDTDLPGGNESETAQADKAESEAGETINTASAEKNAGETIETASAEKSADQSGETIETASAEKSADQTGETIETASAEKSADQTGEAIETASAEKSADQTGETIDIASAEKKLEES